MPHPLPSSTPLPASPDPAFDRYARLVRDLLDVPTALVTLVSADQQVFPGAFGLPEPWLSARCTPLSHSFCQHIVASGEPLAVEDARQHPLLADNLAIPDLAVVAYAGMPLTDDTGAVIGSLCAIDHRPRRWSERALASLADLAAACSSELQLRLARAEADTDRARLELATAAGTVGTFDWDLAGDRMTWDAPLMAVFGYRIEDFDPTTASFYSRLHPDDADRVSQAIETAVTTAGDFSAEYRIVLPGGDTRWVEGRGRVLLDSAGTPFRFVGAAWDTTGVHVGDTRVGRLLDAMPWGFLSLDRRWRFTVLNPAAETLVGRTLAEVAGRTLWEVFPHTVGTDVERTYRRAMDTGVPATLRAWYSAPLDAWFDISCWPSPDGLSLFFTDITERVVSGRQAAAVSARVALQARVADAMADATDVEEALTEVAQLLVPAAADACVVTVLGPDGRARDVSSWHHDPCLLPHVRGYASTRLVDLSGETPFGQALHAGTGRHVSVDQVAAVPMHPDARRSLDALGPTWASIVPLRAHGRPMGALTLLNSADRSRDPDTEDTLTDIADRIGAALDHHRLTRARTQLAEDLQRSLLTAPPEPDHAQVVVRYLPATEAARVGGDWYDAFLQPDGTTMIVIGDVAGHDTAAAVAMGQIRGLLRGIATYSGAGPAEVLRGLDSCMQVLEVNTLATAAIARFEQTPEEVERGVTRMVWANAGHPPPLVLNPDGTFQVLAPWKGELLLGVDPDTSRTEQVATLDRGATVLLFTDGLIERRDADLDDGLARLTAIATRLAGATLDDLCDGLIHELVDGHPDDDVALVAVRLHRQDSPRPAEAGPQHVPDGVPEPTRPAQ